jgi:hypothetical protein
MVVGILGLERLSKSGRSLIGAAIGLTAQATWPVAARSDEALFKSYCAKCHARAQTLARRLPGKSPEEKSALLAKFLETQHPPSAEQRAALVSYLVGIGKP